MTALFNPYAFALRRLTIEDDEDSWWRGFIAGSVFGWSFGMIIGCVIGIVKTY
uniref:Uncharacterized protein n=1 Tax=viral metagenome TaxID=1070528 RepID=A0A6C0LRD2_9ZZZZ